MTPLELQDSIAKDLAVLFDGKTFEDETGAFVPLRIFTQDHPILESANDPGIAPCIIVYLDSWKEEEPDGFITATIMFSVTCCDFRSENQGHRLPAQILQRIYEHYYEDPYVGGFFRFEGYFDAHLLNPSDEFGFFGGWAETKFVIPPMQRKGGINA